MIISSNRFSLFLAACRRYDKYAPTGGEAIAPEVLLGLHLDHDKLAHFRKSFLREIRALFVQILLMAQAGGVLMIGNISLDGSKIHADASKSHVVSYKRLMEMEVQMKEEVRELMDVGERADQGEIQIPDGMLVENQYNFTDPESRIMKNSQNAGYDQHYTTDHAS